jgi:hypothetical protein
MPRRATSSPRGLPPPLPPERRTVGQLVAESIRLYGAQFRWALPLGLVVAVADQLSTGAGRVGTGAVLLAAAPAFTLAYAYATQLATETRAAPRAWAVALAAGVVVWIPAALLIPWFSIAAVLWLALFGLAVPAALVERTSVAGAFRRGFELGRAGYLHAAGSLVTLVILFAFSRYGLALLLESQADNTVRIAIFLADVVLSPVLFLGGALLYVDQEARLRSRPANGAERREEQDADVPDADDPDREGRADPAREPRAPA